MSEPTIIAELKILNTVIGQPVTVVFTKVGFDPDDPAEKDVAVEVTEGRVNHPGLLDALVKPIAKLHHWKSW
jgi:hypothetical protein